MAKWTSRRGAAAAALMALGLVAAGCDATIAPQPQNPGLCPKVYQPVCARTGNGQSQTFPNACTAQTSGYTAYSPGECSRVAPDRICPQTYLPVCASRAGQYMTYPNDCIAGAQGAQVVYRGPC